MTKAFVSYHHSNDQQYKDHISWMASYYGCFEDSSVSLGDIEDDGRSSEKIRRIIRDEYLRDSRVTILLCGTETRYRKHVDWELKSSMINGSVYRRSGILVINLPSISDGVWHANLPGEKAEIYPDYGGNWISFEHKSEYRERYPYMPERIIDNLHSPRAKISVVPWSRIDDWPERLKWLIDASEKVAETNEYDLSRAMRRRNHEPLSNPFGL